MVVQSKRGMQRQCIEFSGFYAKAADGPSGRKQRKKGAQRIMEAINQAHQVICPRAKEEID
jgi:hypothetical protein